MKEIAINCPATVDESTVASVVETACASAALDLTLKSALKKYPGCIHWHFKMRDQKGILEVTWWPGAKAPLPSRLWMSVHGNREADWINKLMTQLKTQMEDQLSKDVRA